MKAGEPFTRLQPCRSGGSNMKRCNTRHTIFSFLRRVPMHRTVCAHYGPVHHVVVSRSRACRRAARLHPTNVENYAVTVMFHFRERRHGWRRICLVHDDDARPPAAETCILAARQVPYITAGFRCCCCSLRTIRKIIAIIAAALWLSVALVTSIVVVVVVNGCEA